MIDSNNKNIFFEAELSTSLDWLFWVVDQYGCDTEVLLTTLKTALVLEGRYPKINFLEMPDYQHDLEMKIEVEVNLARIDKEFGNITAEEYLHKIKNIKSMETREQLKREFLEECQKSSWEVSILVCEFLLFLSDKKSNIFLYYVKSLDKNLYRQVKNIALTVGVENTDLHSLIHNARLIVAHIMSYVSVKDINFISRGDAKNWHRYLANLDQSLGRLAGFNNGQNSKIN